MTKMGLRAKAFKFVNSNYDYENFSPFQNGNSPITNPIIIYILISEPFPLQITLIAIFAGVILVLLVTILVILFRRRICCYDKDGDKVSGTSTDSSALANNVILKVRIIQELGTVKLLTLTYYDFLRPKELLIKVSKS